MLFASAKTCEFCQYEFPILLNELKEGVMVEIKTGTPLAVKGRNVSSLSVEELILMQKAKKISAPGIWRIARTQGAEFLTNYAKEMGYSNGWVWRQKNDMKDSNKIGFRDRVL